MKISKSVFPQIQTMKVLLNSRLISNINYANSAVTCLATYRIFGRGCTSHMTKPVIVETNERGLIAAGKHQSHECM